MSLSDFFYYNAIPLLMAHLLGSLVIWMILKVVTASSSFRQANKPADDRFPTLFSSLFFGFNLVTLAFLFREVEGVDQWLNAFYGSCFLTATYGIVLVACFRQLSKARSLPVMYAAAYSAIGLCVSFGLLILVGSTSLV